MSETFIDPATYQTTGPVIPAGSATAVKNRGLADWLGFAAAPTFAIMALLTGVDNGAPHALCDTHGTSPLSGMALMYWLMSVFHAAPWLKLIANRGRAGSIDASIGVSK
jgi:hypothetical protein